MRFTVAVHELAHAADVLVVNGVALGFAHLLENDLLGDLRGDAAQNSFGRLWNLQLAADLDVGIDLARSSSVTWRFGIFDLLGQSQRRS